jgi:hypothetical protein
MPGAPLGHRGRVGLRQAVARCSPWWPASAPWPSGTRRPSGRGRRVAAVVGVAVVAPLALIALGRAGMPGLERFAALIDGGSRTGLERMLAWDALAKLTVAEPSRFLFGHGPETVTLVLAPHAAEALTRLTPEQVFDRSHSLFWEWWIAAGLFGVAAYVAVIVTAFAAGYRALGWLEGRRDSWSLAVTGVLALALTVVGATLAGSPGLGPPLAAPALAAALVGWGAWSAFAKARRSGLIRRTPRTLLALALLAALTGHLVEGALGLPSATADLCAWTAIGLLAAMGILRQGRSGERLRAKGLEKTNLLGPPGSFEEASAGEPEAGSRSGGRRPPGRPGSGDNALRARPPAIRFLRSWRSRERADPAATAGGLVWCRPSRRW